MEGVILMKDNIEDAVKLLRDNGYFVTKIPEKLCHTANECCETGHGDCMECSCYVCIIGNE
jgi:hypothetical protein